MKYVHNESEAFHGGNCAENEHFSAEPFVAVDEDSTLGVRIWPAGLLKGVPPSVNVLKQYKQHERSWKRAWRCGTYEMYIRGSLSSSVHGQDMDSCIIGP